MNHLIKETSLVHKTARNLGSRGPIIGAEISLTRTITLQEMRGRSRYNTVKNI